MKVAFEVMGGGTWQAGMSYADSFIRALKHTFPEEVTLYSLSSPADIPDPWGQKGAEVLTIPSDHEWTPRWIAAQLIKRAAGSDYLRSRVLKRHEINVVFGLILLYRYGRIPTLSWIPDFQHIHLPEMFSASERHQRDQAYLRSAEISSCIILMSESVKRDFESFAPRYAAKARVLKTVSYIPESIYEADLESILNLYHLPERFVYIPNQFWKHKNHEIVFQSLKTLKEKRVDVFVVCSGYQGDYRHPTYFAELLQKISTWDVRDRVAFLGLIPRHHIFLLMRQAVCVLNPSSFEGFGLSVDEARSLGKRVLLSDIPVHREQDPPKATYFDPNRSEDFAEKLSLLWREALPGPDAELELEARNNLSGRLRACAESFMSVVKEVVRS